MEKTESRTLLVVEDEKKNREELRYKLTGLGFQPPPTIESTERSQGEIPHVLSRLEYLEIKMNSWWGCTAQIDDISLHYTSNPKENTIYIEIFYLSYVNPELIEHQISGARRALLHQVEVLGWGDWINIEIKKTRVDPQRTNSISLITLKFRVGWTANA